MFWGGHGKQGWGHGRDGKGLGIMGDDRKGHQIIALCFILFSFLNVKKIHIYLT